jgi:cell wall-associated protease
LLNQSYINSKPNIFFKFANQILISMKFYLKSISIITISIVFTNCSSTKIIEKPNSIKTELVLTKKRKITEEEKKRWSHLCLEKDTIPGMSIDRAYELLKNRPSQKIIVAVIDSGIDAIHPDLQPQIWTNTKEIPNNGIDDDKNGFIDDIHGWNFLGESNDENLEFTRIIKQKDDGSETYKKALKKYEEELKEAMQGKKVVDDIFEDEKAIKEYLKKDDFTLADVKSILTSDAKLFRAKSRFVNILSGISKEEFDKNIKEYKEHIYDQLNFHLNKEYDGRILVNNDANVWDNKPYGNNKIEGRKPDEAKHGTHVAGIIAQTRGNGLGGDGVFNNVEIMCIKAVPNGDEYDKDIAKAIRYAVDNGAKVINGSFGKSFSPQKQWVFEAIKYADSKDVIFVHAAGNDAKDIDVEDNFPNDSEDKIKEISKSFITIGALAPEYGTDMVANFSNYGKLNVDIFAPGVEIYATTPNNSYEFLEGTSMAAPNAAGVVAMIRSYFPNLKAHEVKNILLESGISINKEVKVGKSGTKKPFSELSKTGKIVNAYYAVLLATQKSK